MKTCFSYGWRWNSLWIPNHCHIRPLLSNDTSHASCSKCQMKFTIKMKRIVDMRSLFSQFQNAVSWIPNKNAHTLKFNTLPTFSPVMVDLWAKLFSTLSQQLTHHTYIHYQLLHLTRNQSWNSAIVGAPWSQTTTHTMTHYQWFEIDFSVQSYKSYRTRPCITVYS